MTIQVAGAAAVRRRRLIDIYGCRTIKSTLLAGWLSCPAAQGGGGCMGRVCGGSGALGARKP
ncbi:hypothetical protein COCMIDRAFT_103350 [Bipolaris oryzae ATCC 44560]|uniref:Uncharacterized protein n=1 Tax=Bipolaris oryzae ATCC 44560 TaxID=930090 RepID=W6YY57_COCMI|nr:uncharacterized protein COCMIDRAFT_103350 [Bipolaris oryzae ATCC 44560]EUC42510.1 hypothetical protein COCMIDRAFT_103350 [Bipolaris oryzae ATCC 44560]